MIRRARSVVLPSWQSAPDRVYADCTVWTYGRWTVDDFRYRGSKHPWIVCFDGKPLVRAHGTYCQGYLRFGTAEAAKKRVQLEAAQRRLY